MLAVVQAQRHRLDELRPHRHRLHAEYLPRERLSGALAALRDRLNDSGRLVVFITKRNWLTRLLVGWWWESNLYRKDELLAEFERAGFSQVRFSAFPLTVRYLAAWGYVVEAWH
jgi:hypothetical protein